MMNTEVPSSSSIFKRSDVSGSVRERVECAKNAFRVFNTDRKGFVELQDLFQLCTRYNLISSMEAFTAVSKTCAKDEEGRVRFDTFLENVLENAEQNEEEAVKIEPAVPKDRVMVSWQSEISERFRKLHCACIANDIEKSGQINVDMLVQLCVSAGLPATDTTHANLKTYVTPPGHIENEILFVAPELLGKEEALKLQHEEERKRRAQASARPNDFFKFAEYHENSTGDTAGKPRMASNPETSSERSSAEASEANLADARQRLYELARGCANERRDVDYSNFLKELRQREFPSLPESIVPQRPRREESGLYTTNERPKWMKAPQKTLVLPRIVSSGKGSETELPDWMRRPGSKDASATATLDHKRREMFKNDGQATLQVERKLTPAPPSAERSTSSPRTVLNGYGTKRDTQKTFNRMKGDVALHLRSAQDEMNRRLARKRELEEEMRQFIEEMASAKAVWGGPMPVSVDPTGFGIQ